MIKGEGLGEVGPFGPHIIPTLPNKKRTKKQTKMTRHHQQKENDEEKPQRRCDRALSQSCPKERTTCENANSYRHFKSKARRPPQMCRNWKTQCSEPRNLKMTKWNPRNTDFIVFPRPYLLPSTSPLEISAFVAFPEWNSERNLVSSGFVAKITEPKSGHHSCSQILPTPQNKGFLSDKRPCKLTRNKALRCLLLQWFRAPAVFQHVARRNSA